jgi:hypothetical protein
VAVDWLDWYITVPSTDVINSKVGIYSTIALSFRVIKICYNVFTGGKPRERTDKLFHFPFHLTTVSIIRVYK